MPRKKKVIEQPARYLLVDKDGEQCLGTEIEIEKYINETYDEDLKPNDFEIYKLVVASMAFNRQIMIDV